jgi:hypothetical protein
MLVKSLPFTAPAKPWVIRQSIQVPFATDHDSTVFDPVALFEPEPEAQPQSRRQTRRELVEV